MGWLERWDARNQRVLDEQNRSWKDWGPGHPSWREIDPGLSLMGLIGLVAVVVTATGRLVTRRLRRNR